MTSRNLPAIRRIRQTRYVASDGRAFDSHVDAFRHETRLALEARLARQLVEFTQEEIEGVAAALLAAPELRIVLIAPSPLATPGAPHA